MARKMLTKETTKNLLPKPTAKKPKGWKDAVAPEEPESPPVSRAGEPMEKVMFRVPVRVLAPLRDEAFKRAQARGSGKPNASGIVADLLEAWATDKGTRAAFEAWAAKMKP